jgi:hypothetical protein
MFLGKNKGRSQINGYPYSAHLLLGSPADRSPHLYEAGSLVQSGIVRSQHRYHYNFMDGINGITGLEQTHHKGRHE